MVHVKNYNTLFNMAVSMDCLKKKEDMENVLIKYFKFFWRINWFSTERVKMDERQELFK